MLTYIHLGTLVFIFSPLFYTLFLSKKMHKSALNLMVCILIAVLVAHVLWESVLSYSGPFYIIAGLFLAPVIINILLDWTQNKSRKRLNLHCNPKVVSLIFLLGYIIHLLFDTIMLYQAPQDHQHPMVDPHGNGPSVVALVIIHRFASSVYLWQKLSEAYKRFGPKILAFCFTISTPYLFVYWIPAPLWHRINEALIFIQVVFIGFLMAHLQEDLTKIIFQKLRPLKKR